MDLLGGYDSDDKSNSSTTTSSRDSGDEDTAPTAPLSGTQPLSPAAAAAEEEASSSKSSKKPVEKSRRGKRLVSLHAVLPTHILEQLTKSAATGGALDDDSDEEENVVASSRLTKDSRRQQHATTVIMGKDEGLSSFLSELQSAPTSVSFLTKSTTTADTKPSPPSSQQPMLGQAFTTTHTVVVSQMKNEEIVNVHATKRPEPAAEVKPFCVSSEPNHAETGQKPTAAAERPAAPPRPSLAFASVPRPGMNNRPVISAPLPAAATTTEQPPQPQYLAQSCQPSPADEGTVNGQQRLAKKRSRQELERALRAGNLQALEEDGVTTVVEAEASTYAPREETYRVPSLGSVTKVASVSMYDPKAGTDVMQAGGAATGKQRGKHQINALLASAASLELQRARAIGTSGGGKGKRADAKRKYGW